MNSEKFNHFDSEGNLVATLSVSEMEDSICILKYSRPMPNISYESWYQLFNKGVEQAKKFNSKKIMCRIRTDFDPSLFKSILSNLSFQAKFERIEFKCDVDKLPDDNESPLQWKSLSELKWSEEKLVSFIQRITQDALDVEKDDSIEDFMRDFLHNEELTHGPDCVHIGFHHHHPSDPCAFVVAQIHPQTGWSRLSYMGLIPESRNKKLGKWVHRHGFTMLKSQGGTTLSRRNT